MHKHNRQRTGLKIGRETEQTEPQGTVTEREQRGTVRTRTILITIIRPRFPRLVVIQTIHPPRKISRLIARPRIPAVNILTGLLTMD